MKKNIVRRVILVLIVVLVVIFSLVLFMAIDDSIYVSKMKNKIINNTDVTSIEYINYYDGYYIVDDGEFLYLFDKKYRELLREDKITVSENINNYDIIYRDKKLMYFNESSKDDKLIYTYYDIKTYKEIESIIFGG